ncbi:hypothetical protein K1719_024290 [Acacia pycnantha]|nr:hypothetical protein K1719_024290 [Acacia pycnantha]
MRISYSSLRNQTYLVKAADPVTETEEAPDPESKSHSSVFSVFNSRKFIYYSILCRIEVVEPLACNPRDDNTKNLGFYRASLPVEERVRDLIGKLMLQEKVTFMGDNAATIPWLGIKWYKLWMEVLHRVSNVGPGIGSLLRSLLPLVSPKSSPSLLLSVLPYRRLLDGSDGEGRP